MTHSQFHKLKHGNVIESSHGRYMVLHTKRNSDGVTEVGVIRSVNYTNANLFELVDATAEETKLVDGILQSVTVKDEPGKKK